MKLQLALDTLSLEDCLTLLEETKGIVDIAEIGTPFIIKEGIKPVRVIKENFPQLEVLADIKIMDAEALESETAFRAGTDIITVLSVSNNETILDAVKTAKKYKGKVMVDMIAVKDLVERTKEIDAMGVDYICVHTAFDIQATGKNPLDELIEVNKVIKNAKSAVAGGVKLATIDEIVNEGAEIIVVGGAVSNAINRTEMAVKIKKHIK